MALMRDDNMRELWDKAHGDPPQPWCSVALWARLLHQHIFAAEGWAFKYGPPMVDSQTQYLTITIEFAHAEGMQFYEGEGIPYKALFSFHAATPYNEGDAGRMKCEAAISCREYFARPENGRLRRLVVLTSLGTRGRIWEISRDETTLSPLTHDGERQESIAWVEINSDQSAILDLYLNSVVRQTPLECDNEVGIVHIRRFIPEVIHAHIYQGDSSPEPGSEAEPGNGFEYGGGAEDGTRTQAD
ncbi:hypothetical protein BJX76DRAFT_362576 [Aspergillus varians]